MLNIERRTESGIVINLPGTESTGFSLIGHIVGQIVDGLREREAVSNIMEENGRGKESKNGLGCCGDTAVDKRASHAGIYDRSRARGGGMVTGGVFGSLARGRI